jgi:hypothetical protein
MTSAEDGFAAFRGPVDREVFAPGFVAWARLGEALQKTWHAIVALPDRGLAAEALQPEFFRFPSF